MHPDLSSHLHTDECNKIIQAYFQCHQDNPWKKFIGVCNDADRKMNACLKRERGDQIKAHRIVAKERLQKVRDKENERARQEAAK